MSAASDASGVRELPIDPGAEEDVLLRVRLQRILFLRIFVVTVLFVLALVAESQGRVPPSRRSPPTR